LVLNPTKLLPAAQKTGGAQFSGARLDDDRIRVAAGTRSLSGALQWEE